MINSICSYIRISQRHKRRKSRQIKARRPIIGWVKELPDLCRTIRESVGRAIGCELGLRPWPTGPGDASMTGYAKVFMQLRALGNPDRAVFVYYSRLRAHSSSAGRRGANAKIRLSHSGTARTASSSTSIEARRSADSSGLTVSIR